jgi:hypothetical protein
VAQQRWEYETSVWAPPHYAERQGELHEMLAAKGEDGWELATSFMGVTGGVVFIYKRPASGFKGRLS